MSVLRLRWVDDETSFNEWGFTLLNCLPPVLIAKTLNTKYGIGSLRHSLAKLGKPKSVHQSVWVQKNLRAQS